MLFLVSCNTARISNISNRRVRAVSHVQDLLELFTQSELADTGSTGDGEEYESESNTHVCQCSFSHRWPHCFGHYWSKYGLSNSIKNAICSGVAVYSDIKYHTPAVLQVLINKIERRQNSYVGNGCWATCRPRQGEKLARQLVCCEIKQRMFSKPRMPGK